MFINLKILVKSLHFFNGTAIIIIYSLFFIVIGLKILIVYLTKLVVYFFKEGKKIQLIQSIIMTRINFVHIREQPRKKTIIIFFKKIIIRKYSLN